MAEQNLNGIRVAILATDGFEQIELEGPRKALDSAGAKTTVISPKCGTIYGMKHHDKAGTTKVDLELNAAKPEDFGALLLPGAGLNANALRVEPKAQEFARKMDREGKPAAVICHGPWLLVSAGLTKGRALTSYHTIQDGDGENSRYRLPPWSSRLQGRYALDSSVDWMRSPQHPGAGRPLF